MRRLNPFLKSPLVLAAMAALCPLAGHGQTQDTLPTVSVTATPMRANQASVAGWGDLPAWQAPFQAQTFSAEALSDAQVTRLADLTKLDASTTDAYNTAGYWDILSVRGFTLETASNFRREGLPINGETRLPLDNKSAVELFKGLSGLQAGVSAPSGLLNLVVKRPDERVRQVSLSFNDAGNQLAAVDLGDRFGEQREFGLRVNAALERLDTHIEHTSGHRKLFALATDWVPAPGHVIELELERSHLSQPSVPGYSLLGGVVPSAKAVDLERNFNAMPWTLPVKMVGTTGTLRWRGELGQGLKAGVTYGEQRLRSDDRAAFPFGCGDNFDYTQFCADGGYILSDFRSEHEHRDTRALLAELSGQAHTGRVAHDWRVAVLRSHHDTKLGDNAFNEVGVGNIYAPLPDLPADPTLTWEGTSRRDRSTELSVQDAVTFNAQWRAWLGLRHTQIHRSAQSSQAASPFADFRKDLTTPWAAVGYELAHNTQVYVSWGEGVELAHAPQLSSTPGLPLAALKSRQTEVGIKGQSDWLRQGHQQWSLAAFQVRRPYVGYINATDYVQDGSARHRGLEGQWLGRLGRWQFSAGAMVLDTERRGSATADVNGQSTPNVPDHTVKGSVQYSWATSWPLTVQADLVREGRRWVDAANTVRLPAWNRVDVSARLAAPATEGANWQFQLGVTNLFDTKAWREAPVLTGHYYLYPVLSRTVTLTAQTNF